MLPVTAEYALYLAISAADGLFEELFQLLIEQEGQKRGDAVLDEVKGQNAEGKKGIDVIYRRHGLCAHRDYRLNGCAVERRIHRYRDECIEEDTDDAGKGGGNYQADECSFFGLFDPVNDRRRQDEHDAGDEICKLPDKGGLGTGHEQLKADLEHADDNTADGPEVEGCKQRRNIRNIEFQEKRHEGQGEIEAHQHCCERAEQRNEYHCAHIQHAFFLFGLGDLFHFYSVLFSVKKKLRRKKAILGAASSHIRTVPSVSEFHRIVPNGLRTLPPVGNFTPPRRILFYFYPSGRTYYNREECVCKGNFLGKLYN